MKKSLLSALGIAVALAFSMPVLGNAAAMTTAAPAAAAAAPNQHRLHHRATPASTKKACKETKKHKCPVKHHKKHAMKTAAPKKAY